MVAEAISTWEFVIFDEQFGDLLRAVRDELSANELNERIVLAHPAVVPEGVGGTVHAHEAFAAGNGCVECFFTLGRHGWLLVGTSFGQVAGGFEGEGVPLANLIRLEHAAIFAASHFKAETFADLCKDFVGMGWLAIRAELDHGMLKAGAFCEEQNFFASQSRLADGGTSGEAGHS